MPAVFNENEMIELSTVQKGTIGELLAKALFMKQGFNIFDKVNEESKCDFILEKNNKLIKLQVKITSVARENKCILTRKLSHSKTEHKTHYYTSNEIDFYVAVDIEELDLYILPMSIYSEIKSSKILDNLQEFKNNFGLIDKFIE